MVPSERIDEAREIIAEIDSGAFAELNEELQASDTCSVCGSALVRKTRTSWKLAIFIGHLLFFPLPFGKNKFSCPRCIA